MELNAIDYLNAQRFRKRFVHYFMSVMKDIDIILAPTNSRSPFTINSKKPEDNMDNIYTLGKTPLINFLGFPAINVPLGMLSDQLPSGLQMIAKPFQEETLCQVAKKFAETIDTTEWEKVLIEKYH